MLAVVWHYWIAVVLVVTLVVPLVLWVGIGYLIKVVRPQYPTSRHIQD